MPGISFFYSGLHMNTAVYIGRFQFLHNTHKDVILHGINHYDELMIIIGSATTAPNEKNPLQYHERLGIMKTMLANIGFIFSNINVETGGMVFIRNDNKKVSITPVADYFTDDEWRAQINIILHNKNYELINPFKDAGNYWSKYFVCNPAPFLSNHNASDIRYKFFSGNPITTEDNACVETINFLNDWQYTPECHRICNEFVFHEKIRQDERDRIEYNKTAKALGKLPHYKQTFVTGDCAIIQKVNNIPKILLITRKNIPGVGQLAIPGGYFEPDSDNSEYDTAIREAREEVGIELTEDEMLKYYTHKPVRFGTIGRSLRGRILTTLHVFIIPEEVNLNCVAQVDEVIAINWYSQDEVLPSQCFEDHYFMIQEAFRQA
jgi:bifunctional NMN adenylyltransferase/nudix hydrolase